MLTQPLDREETTLISNFLLRLELLRLTEVQSESNGQSRAELMLIKENEILRSRLTSLKDNITVLNKMIDQIRTGSAHHRSVGLKSSSGPQSVSPRFKELMRTRT